MDRYTSKFLDLALSIEPSNTNDKYAILIWRQKIFFGIVRPLNPVVNNIFYISCAEITDDDFDTLLKTYPTIVIDDDIALSVENPHIMRFNGVSLSRLSCNETLWVQRIVSCCITSPDPVYCLA